MDLEGIIHNAHKYIIEANCVTSLICIILRKEKITNSEKEISFAITEYGGRLQGNWKKVVKGTNFQL